jgi:hypothetical protein
VRRARARRTLARTPHQFKHPTRARAAVAVADRADDRPIDRVARLSSKRRRSLARAPRSIRRSRQRSRCREVPTEAVRSPRCALADARRAVVARRNRGPRASRLVFVAHPP